MNIKQLGSNQTLLETNHGWLILYSYETAVAGYNPVLNIYFKTNKHYSNTTTRHINKWLTSQGDVNTISMNQNEIDNIGFLIGAE